MDVTQIPFIKHVGIEREEEDTLKLKSVQIVKNHLGDIHAAAQYALAETQTGLQLELVFPQYVGKVLGLLRNASVKYKHPAKSSIYAVANIEEDEKNKFLQQIERKGRASIVVQVEVLDDNNMLIMIGKFHWFIQKLDSLL